MSDQEQKEGETTPQESKAATEPAKTPEQANKEAELAAKNELAKKLNPQT